MNHIAMWDGKYFSSLQTGSSVGGVNGPVSALAVSGNSLYIGGGFTTAGGIPVNNIATWNGKFFSPLSFSRSLIPAKCGVRFFYGDPRFSEP